MRTLLTLLFLCPVVFGQTIISKNEFLTGLGSLRYEIDASMDDGSGLYIPVKMFPDVTNRAKFTVVYVPRDYGGLINELLPVVGGAGRSYCPDQSLDYMQEQFSFAKKLPTGYCENLNDDVKNLNHNLLSLCLRGILKKLNPGRGQSSSWETRRNLYSLSEPEQEFAAAIFTLFGEARGASEEDAALVLMSLYNRKRNARERKCVAANLLDIALQPSQYSMWLSTDPNWKAATSPSHYRYGIKGETQSLEKMIDVFVKYKQGGYQIESKDGDVKDVFHYHTPAVSPYWGRYNKAVRDLSVNGKQIGRDTKPAHYFIRRVDWKFQYNSLKAHKKEKGCPAPFE